MPNTILPKMFSNTYNLMRLGTPTGYLIIFFSSCMGVALAGTNQEHINKIPILFIGSILGRGAGCIINDILDRNLDAMVGRTRNRPLASGSASVLEAIILLSMLVCCCLYILFTFSITSIMIGVIASLMISIYPLMKRITYFPQIFLGFTFNLGVLIGYACITDTLTYQAILLYIACCFWTFGFDTIYAFMDLEDDKKANIKSMAVLLEMYHYKFWISLFYAIFIVLFIAANYMNGNLIMPLFGAAIASYILGWQVYTLDISDIHNCLQRFKSNNYVGLLLTLAIILA